MLILLALAASTGSSSDQTVSDMTALYEQVCLNTFPDDTAVESAMAKLNARELTPDEVKVTMGDDPARGWELQQDGNPTVWLEFPPYHACSVRWNSPEFGPFDDYRALADRYEKEKGGFHPLEPYDADTGDIHIHAVGEQRTLPDKTLESLFIFDQHIPDPKRRAAGETGYVLRFVHQFHADSGAQ
jgi:hypothetical protein